VASGLVDGGTESEGVLAVLSADVAAVFGEHAGAVTDVDAQRLVYGPGLPATVVRPLPDV